MRRAWLAVALVVPPPVIDLPTQATTVIRAPIQSVAPAGDFNGDGIGDLVAGVPEIPRDADPPRAGAFVIFGRTDLPRGLSLTRGGPAALLIRGGEQAGTHDPPLPIDAAAAGDVNGDGLADVAVTAPSERSGLPALPTANYRIEVLGVTYIVYGRRGGGTLELDRLGPADGFAIRGAGDAVEPVGDVNGDGRDDLAVASFRSEAPDRVHVVYGGRTGTFRLVDGHAGARGWTIDVSLGEPEIASPLSGAGDVDDDGLADLVIAATPVHRRVIEPGVQEVAHGPSTVHVVLGRRTNGTLRIGAPGSSAGVVRPRRFGLPNSAVLGPGDVDGDGRSDVVIGAPLRGTTTLDRLSGFGRGGVVLLSAPAGGPRTLEDLPVLLRGAAAGAGAGLLLSRAGDVDDDGRADILAVESMPFDLIDTEDSRPGTTRLLRAGGQTAFPGRPMPPIPADVGDVTGDGEPELLFTLADGCGNAGAVVVDLTRPLPPPPGAGADTVSGGPGLDLLYGGAGDDVLDGSGERDCMHGDAGADILIGGAGADRIFGAAGDDRVDAGPGADLVVGAAGDDLVAGGAGVDSLIGGAGDDRLSSGTNRGQPQAGGGLELLEGENGNDRLRGGDGADQLDGGLGDDLLEGGSGDDRLEGGDGQDFVIGGPGRDHIVTGEPGDHDGGDAVSAGAGDDRVFAVNGGHDHIRCGPGRDVVTAERRDRVSRDCERRHDGRPRPR